MHRARPRRVEDEELAISIDGFQQQGFDPGLVYVYLTLPAGADPGAAEAAVFDELAALIADGISDAELAKAKNILLADFWRDLATIDGKAEALGTFEVFHGGFERLFERPADVDALGADALKQVAERVFQRRNATIGVLRAPAGDES